MLVPYLAYSSAVATGRLGAVVPLTAACAPYFGTCSFICRSTSSRKQRSDLFGIRIRAKLPSVTRPTSLTIQSCRGIVIKCLVQGQSKRTFRLVLILSL